MSKRGCTPERRGQGCGMRKQKRPMLGLVPCSRPTNRRPARQRFLYLVLDDWERGYSIFRVGEDDLDSDVGLDAHLAESPVVRIQAQHWFEVSFAAHGTKILAMHPSRFSPGIPVFDTETLGVTMCSFPKSRTGLGAHKLVYASVGDSILAFVSRFLELLGPEPLPAEKESSWSWASIEPPPPFESNCVSSYALHPDGRTVVMSVKNWGSKNDWHIHKRSSTFAFDTERLEWTHLGEWLLPFKGRGHYDRDLDAWIGLCRFEQGAGHLCSCDVPPIAERQTMPAWKLGKHVFFDVDSIRHKGATLVYMGDGKFCLIECRLPEDYESYPCSRKLKITSCVLKYDKYGELVTTHCRSYSSISYQTAREHLNLEIEDPVAFWM